jgi:hypothetical protein
MTLQASADTWQEALRAANAIFAGRPPRTGAEAMPAGIVTGMPVWVRNTNGHAIVVMITMHSDAPAAAKTVGDVAEEFAVWLEIAARERLAAEAGEGGDSEASAEAD